jgi:hypothetical protein
MRVSWWWVVLAGMCSLLTAGASDSLRDYYRQRAPEFVFDRREFRIDCSSWPSKEPARPGKAFMAISPRAPFRQTRIEDLTFSRTDVPALTLALDLSAAVKIAGEEREDWDARLCAQGEGETEAEANAKMQDVAISRIGGTVSVAGRGSEAMSQGRGELLLHAPADSPVTFHSSYAWVEVRDMRGPVRVSASHARTTILDTTGRVDVNGDLVDFAGAKGTVLLNATSEIDLKLTQRTFEGSLTASADRAVRVLMPPGFLMPFEVLVSKREDFVCRADVCAGMVAGRKNGWYEFTYKGNGGAAPAAVNLQSQHGTVVVDTDTH